MIVYGYLREKGGKDMAIVLKDMIITWWVPPTSYYMIKENKYTDTSRKPWRRYAIVPRWNFNVELD